MEIKPLGPLESYKSLTDENLARHFANPRKRKYLQEMGLITQDGLVLDNESVRLFNLHKENEMKSKQQLQENLYKRAVELERRRRAKLNKKLEQLEKFEKVETVKYRSRYPWGVARISSLPTLSDTFKSHKEKLNLSSDQLTEFSKMVSRVVARRSLPSIAPSPYLQKLSPTSVSYRPCIPHPPSSEPRSLSTMRSRRFRSVRRRPKTAPVELKSDTLIDKIHTNIAMTFSYLGGGVSLENRASPTMNIQVHQQHCGGNTLCVFNGNLRPNGEFTLVSRRHYGSPLGLSLYINGMIDCRLSCCCEYKHTPGKLIGGRSAHFRLIRVEGGKKCYRCQADSAKNEESREQYPKVNIINNMESDRDGQDYESDFGTASADEKAEKYEMNYDSDGNSSSSSSASTTSTNYASSQERSVKSRSSSQISDKSNRLEQETQSTEAAHEETDNYQFEDDTVAGVSSDEVQNEPQLEIPEKGTVNEIGGGEETTPQNSDDNSTNVGEHIGKVVEPQVNSPGEPRPDLVAGETELVHKDPQNDAELKKYLEGILERAKQYYEKENCKRQQNEERVSENDDKEESICEMSSDKMRAVDSPAREGGDVSEQQTSGNHQEEELEIKKTASKLEKERDELKDEEMKHVVAPDITGKEVPREEEETTPPTPVEELAEITEQDVVEHKNGIVEVEDPWNDAEVDRLVEDVIRRAVKYCQDEILERQRGNKGTVIHEKSEEDPVQEINDERLRITESEMTMVDEPVEKSQETASDTLEGNVSEISIHLPASESKGELPGEEDEQMDEVSSEIENGRKTRLGVRLDQEEPESGNQTSEHTSEDSASENESGNQSSNESNNGDAAVNNELHSKSVSEDIYVDVLPNEDADIRKQPSVKSTTSEPVKVPRRFSYKLSEKIADPCIPTDPTYVTEANCEYISLDELQGPHSSLTSNYVERNDNHEKMTDDRDVAIGTIQSKSENTKEKQGRRILKKQDRVEEPQPESTVITHSNQHDSGEPVTPSQQNMPKKQDSENTQVHVSYSDDSSLKLDTPRRGSSTSQATSVSSKESLTSRESSVKSIDTTS